MKFRLVVTPEAKRNIDNLFGFIARDHPANAQRFVHGLEKGLKTLRTLPRRCPRAPEDGRRGLEMRHLIYGDYRIVFAIVDTTVFVLQVRHGARLPVDES